MPVRNGYEIDRLGVKPDFLPVFLFSQAIINTKGDEPMKSLLKLVISLAVKVAIIALIYAIAMGFSM